MPEVIDFKAEHDRRNGPDAEHILEDYNGDLWFRFLVKFQHPPGSFTGGETGVVYIWAKDFEHAEEVLRAVRQTGEVHGQVYRTEPQ